ncbi:lipopolysaccharide transport periplasmic protein LptA [Pseudoalteromonas rubra]|uniref:Lipopolysaccharide transport periplasmic protein LptA n=1 Tax=Pseudoalteromonas rubra TaxID=43658 RepID=A0A5S3WPE5_9GAMM|nr:lipopolysaccharide transport periplasmic protein LptA [Pseudoalteromonas rubra]TMP30066.1 lipopolysaccharide transport periplasmic protein LptA [Pseudoalteromonas rubra]TMP35665.1 lipopolysaccharide transport periplasmic protein LptA [Pseudoalteromonas rubra]
MNNKFTYTLILLCTLSAFQPSAYAEDTLTDQVIISSGTQLAQLQTNIGVFEENVEIIHGDRTILADRLEVHRREELGKNKQLLVATGSPAVFQERQADGSLLKATAKEVRYDVANRMLTIKGGAEISQAGQKISAQTIVYDMEKKLISAQRGDQEKNRVRTILLPEKENSKNSQKKGNP